MLGWRHCRELTSPHTDSIFHDPETRILFASFKYVGTDYEGDMAKMRQNAKVREWYVLPSLILPGRTGALETIFLRFQPTSGSQPRTPADLVITGGR